MQQQCNNSILAFDRSIVVLARDETTRLDRELQLVRTSMLSVVFVCLRFRFRFRFGSTNCICIIVQINKFETLTIIFKHTHTVERRTRVVAESRRYARQSGHRNGGGEAKETD
jgi:putative heme iron utilization protein